MLRYLLTALERGPSVQSRTAGRMGEQDAGGQEAIISSSPQKEDPDRALSQTLTALGAAHQSSRESVRRAAQKLITQHVEDSSLCAAMFKVARSEGSDLKFIGACAFVARHYWVTAPGELVLSVSVERRTPGQKQLL